MAIAYGGIACGADVNDWREPFKTADTVPSFNQIEKLSEEEIAKLPAVETLTEILKQEQRDRKNPTTIKSLVILIIEEALSDLKFYQQLPKGVITEELNKAVKHFQASIGKEPTGILLMEEWKVLNGNVTKTKYQDIRPFNGNEPLLVEYGGSALITASGTWIIEGEKIASPINMSRIECSREERICRESSAEIVSSAYLNVDSSSYQITKWSAEEVTAENLALCRIVTLTINIKSKEVFQIIRNRTSEDCGSLPKLEKPRITRLVKGFDVAEQYYKEKAQERLSVLNPEYKKAVMQLQGK